jgi:hypothetical protein
MKSIYVFILLTLIFSCKKQEEIDIRESIIGQYNLTGDFTYQFYNNGVAEPIFYKISVFNQPTKFLVYKSSIANAVNLELQFWGIGNYILAKNQIEKTYIVENATANIRLPRADIFESFTVKLNGKAIFSGNDIYVNIDATDADNKVKIKYTYSGTKI